MRYKYMPPIPAVHKSSDIHLLVLAFRLYEIEHNDLDRVGGGKTSSCMSDHGPKTTPQYCEMVDDESLLFELYPCALDPG